MIISRTPYRISLFGGGTDYPSWYNQHGGAVIGTTINKYCYISIRALPPFFTHRHRIVYSKIELPNEIEAIEHPAVRAVLMEFGVNNGIEIHHSGDLPARSGMGSSSSFTVGLINAVRALQCQMSSPEWLAREAIRIEQHVIGETVGSQDQVWAAFGGTNIVTFDLDGRFMVTPVMMTPERRSEFQDHLLLFFTGFSRIAEVIAAKTIENLGRNELRLRMMRSMVDEAAEILQSPRRPLRELGAMLRDAWSIKRELADCVTTPLIDQIYEEALRAGALGGKLLGAGGGGFMLLVAEPNAHARIREALKRLIEVSFRIGSTGSRIVVYDPVTAEEEYSSPVATPPLP